MLLVANDFSEIWLWQCIISPHMAGLADALCRLGHKVTYVAEREMSSDRAAQGWQAPSLGGARLVLAPTAVAAAEIVRNAPTNSVHICQGVRGNGVVGAAQAALACRGLQQWVVMETIYDPGLTGLVKRARYRWLFWRRRTQIAGVLATGWRTPRWVVARGMDRQRVFPFAYFLPDVGGAAFLPDMSASCFRFVYVGQLIERKQLGVLIEALSGINHVRFELIVIGDGPCKTQWKTFAEEKLPGRVRWLGQLPMTQVPRQIREADCLVLPSLHDGWGAVVSEALMAGTPVICSDACGSAGVVRESRNGGVFAARDVGSLAAQLHQMLVRGALALEERHRLAVWAESIGARAGARYLSDILRYQHGYGQRPQVPWQSEK